MKLGRPVEPWQALGLEVSPEIDVWHDSNSSATVGAPADVTRIWSFKEVLAHAAKNGFQVGRTALMGQVLCLVACV
jgi:hypothetical protein